MANSPNKIKNIYEKSRKGMAIGLAGLALGGAMAETAEAAPRADFKKWAKQLTERLNDRQSIPALDGTWVDVQKRPNGAQAVGASTRDGGTNYEGATTYYNYQVMGGARTGGIGPVLIYNPAWKRPSQRALYDPSQVRFGEVVKERGPHGENYGLKVKMLGGFTKTSQLIFNHMPTDGQAPVVSISTPDLRGLGTIPNTGSKVSITMDGNPEHASQLFGADGHKVKISEFKPWYTTNPAEAFPGTMETPDHVDAWPGQPVEIQHPNAKG